MGIRSFIKRKVSEKFSAVESSTTEGCAVRKPLPIDADSEGFIAVIHEGDLSEGRGQTVAAHRTAVALFHANGNYYAIDDACSHEDAPLGEGEIRGHTVACPYHDWVFDFTTGDCISFPERPVGCFATKVADGFGWVGQRTREGTHHRGGDHVDGLTTAEHAS